MAFLAVKKEALFLKIFRNYLSLDTAWHARWKAISSKMRRKEPNI
jgi:hypothetical protein